jgi:hypothetical protein
MTYKSTTQPLCRYCGRAIAKRTTTRRFRPAAARPAGSTIYEKDMIDAAPASKAEAQKHFNQQVVSVRWERGHRSEKLGYEYVDQVGLWDGESYDNAFFCSNAHAIAFAYACATAGYTTKRYCQAVDCNGSDDKVV